MNYIGTMCNLLKHGLWLELIQWIELLELLSAKTCFIFCENSVRPSSETFVYLYIRLVDFITRTSKSRQKEVNS